MAVIEAVHRGDTDAVALLLEAGADPNERDDMGAMEPLNKTAPLVFIAARRGDTAMVRLLSSYGADVKLTKAVSGSREQGSVGEVVGLRHTCV